jgi:uncharacterized membrane protein
MNMSSTVCFQCVMGRMYNIIIVIVIIIIIIMYMRLRYRSSKLRLTTVGDPPR